LEKEISISFGFYSGFNLMLKRFTLIFIFLGFSSCSVNREKPKHEPLTEEFDAFYEVPIEDAQGFSIEYFGNYKKITVHEAYRGAAKPEIYYLLNRGMEVPEELKGGQVIFIPLKSIVPFSTSYIPMIDMIGESEKINGFPGTHLVSTESVVERINLGLVAELGSENGLNREALIDLNPELAMVYTLGSNLDRFFQIGRSGIPVVFNADYLETTPIGRVEWIKFIAAFFNKEMQADSVFRSIKQNYQNYTSLSGSVTNKPLVYSGIMYGDTWFAPGGNSWAARFFEDAGADYLWKETNSSGSLELSFESVFEIAAHADFWIGTADFSSLQMLANSNSKYAFFDAFKNKSVYSYHKKAGANGGNAYLELGYARPDLILADLIHIFHPNLLPTYTTYFYKALD
jgi:iron complex transport system substrate-binding protein